MIRHHSAANNLFETTSYLGFDSLILRNQGRANLTPIARPNCTWSGPPRCANFTTPRTRNQIRTCKICCHLNLFQWLLFYCFFVSPNSVRTLSLVSLLFRASHILQRKINICFIEAATKINSERLASLSCCVSKYCVSPTWVRYRAAERQVVLISLINLR